MTPLLLDDPERREQNSEASTGKISVFLSPEHTRSLLQDVPQATDTRITDVLLTALAQAFADWTNAGPLLVSLEGHGREHVFEDVDLSRTVGWFTSAYPALLGVEPEADPGSALRSIKRQLRRIPGRGFGYGLLRELCSDPEVAARMRQIPEPRVNFNYLGQLDAMMADSTLFKLARDGDANSCDRDSRGTRSHVLEIVGLVLDARLRVDWFYSSNLHRKATIEALASRFEAALQSILEYCQALPPGRKPADLEAFSWNQGDVEDIEAAIRRSQGSG